jgi:hypothetical protein
MFIRHPAANRVQKKRGPKPPFPNIFRNQPINKYRAWCYRR